MTIVWTDVYKNYVYNLQIYCILYSLSLIYHCLLTYVGLSYLSLDLNKIEFKNINIFIK